METQFVAYELAVKLKELGFDGRCIAYYDMEGKLWPMGTVFNGGDLKFGVFNPKYQYKPNLEPLVAAPLWQQVFDWFRNVHKLDGYIQSSKYEGAYYTVNNLDTKADSWAQSSHHRTYEQAKIDCLEWMIEKIKK